MRSARDKDHLMSTIAGSGVYVIASTRASSVASSSSGPGKLEAPIGHAMHVTVTNHSSASFARFAPVAADSYQLLKIKEILCRTHEAVRFNIVFFPPTVFFRKKNDLKIS